MSRSIATIQNLMLLDIKADPVLGPQLTSISKRAYFNLLTYIVATCTYILESLIDIFKTQVETVAASAAPASQAWMQNQVLKFQYSPTVPQIIQLINFAPVYPTVDTSLRIISRASVITTVAGAVLIKVATGNPPGALNSSQLSALHNYVNLIGATIDYTVTSSAADELYIQADVYYQGQYSAIISQDVILAINTYLANLPFNGQLKVSDLELTIRNVQGVTDCVLKNVKARTDAEPFVDGIYLVQNEQWISRVYATVAGYVVSETTSGDTLVDSLNFIAM